ncbi:MAG: hypothetical protein HY960_04895 [Ignavibacteriae bacterium]|nr:hypothetical protein [Ignavibacteriota bacterium]
MSEERDTPEKVIAWMAEATLRGTEETESISETCDRMSEISHQVWEEVASYLEVTSMGSEAVKRGSEEVARRQYGASQAQKPCLW